MATYDWQEARSLLDDRLEGLADDLEELGLTDASVSVFITEGVTSQLPLDLSGAGHLIISVAAEFDSAESAVLALERLESAGFDYTQQAGVTASRFSPDAVTTNAAGGSVPDGAFPGGAAAVLWVEGEVVRMALVQGGDPRMDAESVASRMIEQEATS